MSLVTRMAGAIGLRWGGGALGGPRVWDVTSPSAKLPRFPDPSPNGKIDGQKEMRAAARHLARNNHRFRTALRKKGEIMIGAGPRPKTRFPELLELWDAAKDQFDNREDKSFGLWLADDVSWNLEVDGEVFVLVRNRQAQKYRRDYAHLTVPLQFQALTCDYVDTSVDTEYVEGLRFRHGVALKWDRKIGFATWTGHPQEVNDNGLPPTRVVIEAERMYHHFDAGTGAVRGECPLASVIGTAKNLQDTEDANLHRWKNSAALATYLVKKASAEGLHDVGGAPGEPYQGAPAGPSKAMRNLHMGIGDIAILDEGYEPRQVQPAGEGAGYQTAVRILASLICNVIGVPYYEAMSDWDSVPERAMRPAAVSMKRRMLRDRNRLEHQVLNRMWKDFVIVCVSEGLWTPPPDASLAEIFRVTWRWPVIQTVSLERELKTMSELVLAGLYTPEDFVEDYMGADYKEHTRRWTENVARAKVQGSTVYDKVFAVDEEEGGVAADYMTVAEEEEAYERELARSGRLDRSVLKRPAI